jgi:zinc protease
MHRSSSRALRVLALALAAPWLALAAQQLHVPYQEFTLSNGLRVIVHEDRSVPVVTVNTLYRVGSANERPGRTGFAHLFEHIMFMGSQHVPTGQFDRYLEAAGADNNAWTSQDYTNYYENGPASALELMLYLDGDRLGFLLPEMTAEKVDIQRGVVQNERRQSYENQPYGLAEENILERLFPPQHPYHWPTIGSMADLSAASIDDVRGFFRSYYTPNNAIMVIAGAVNAAEARPLVERWLGDIPRGPDADRPTVPPAPLAQDVYQTLEDRVQLPRVYDVWHTVRQFSDDDAALDVLADVLSGGRYSRFDKRLVYELQNTAEVTAYEDAGRYDGKFVVFATARPGHDLPELQRILDEEIRRVADEGPTQREVQRAINGYEARFLGRMERVLGKAMLMAQYTDVFGEPDSFERDLARYRSVTPADVQRVARQYLTGAHRVVLSVVPQGQTTQAVTGVQP